MRTRTRAILYKGKGYHDSYLAVPEVWGLQTTTDATHDIGLLRSRKGSGVVTDIGGAFSTRNDVYRHSGIEMVSRWNSIYGLSTYYGPVSVTESVPARWTDTAHWSPSSASQLDAFGTSAISRVLPTAPSADLSVFLGELLREGIPKVVGATALKNKFRDHRDIGGEYLNVQFGWLPLVSELKDISGAIAQQEKRIAQLIRDSGRLVRRRFEWPIEIVMEGPVEQGPKWPWPALNRRYYTPNGFTSSYRYNRLYKRRWFSGAFTYNFALSQGQQARVSDQAKKARVLLGLDLTPAVVWNLSPWSWLADWVANTGDILTNVSAFNRDDLVMRYGYIMEETIRETVHGGRGLEIKDYEVVVRRIANMEDRYIIHEKQRRVATPYGFGLNTAGFSPRQWAVLGALGISRGPANRL